MQIRSAVDKAEVRALVETTQTGRAGFVVGRRRHIHLEGGVNLVGELDGASVAIGSLRAGVRHPRLVEIGVDAVDAAVDAVGPLVDAVIEAAGDRIIEVKTADYDGVSHWVRTDPRFEHEITVESGTVSTANRPPTVGFLPVGYAVEALDEGTPEIETLFERIYAEAHAWTGGVVEFPETGSWLSVVGEPVALGVVWNRTGEPVAVSGVSMTGDVSDAAYLLPGGVLESERTQRLEIVSHAIEAALHEAARIGVPEVAYEDSRPDYALQGAVLDGFDRRPHDRTEMWISRNR